LCQLQGYSQVSVDGICNGAHAPATRLRRAARVHEITIAAGSDSSSTFVRQDGGVAPTDAKRVLQCHPESVRLRRSPAAKRLATGSARSQDWRPSCRVSSRPSPRPTPGAVSDELTSSACGLIGFDDPGPQAVTGTYLRRAALDRLSAASSAQSTWATRRKTRRAVRPWGKRALVRFGCFRSAEQGAALRGIRGKSHRIGAYPAPCRSSPGPLF
jgi:hypothetical protein